MRENRPEGPGTYEPALLMKTGPKGLSTKLDKKVIASLVNPYWATARVRPYSHELTCGNLQDLNKHNVLHELDRQEVSRAGDTGIVGPHQHLERESDLVLWLVQNLRQKLLHVSV